MTSVQYSLFEQSAFDEKPDGPDGYDEMVSGRGQIRPHWVGLVGALQAIPEPILSERVERIYRQYLDTALAYSVDGDRRNVEARRPFDLVPMILPEAEWRLLERGLAQRARLLDRLLADVYGARRVLRDRLLPPQLLHGNPRFLRPCCGIDFHAAISHLHSYSADLVRLPDGGWRVLADRLQAPAGIGFALQNRSILARTVPEIFRAHPVRRIEPFLDRWRDSLAALSRRPGQAPRIVLMTPGPFNAAHFEHVYLADQLGAMVVEGPDLTVRDGEVFVKTLGGLERVDVILRFIEDDFIDPLELRGSSVLGIAGLLQAVRAGTVVVANGLGSSAVETPALRQFLPALAQAFLGETLLLPSIETEWLGIPEAAARAQERLDEVTIRPAFASRREEQSFFAAYPRSGRKALLDAIRRRPGGFVAERRFDRSVMPGWDAGHLVPRPVTLRMFLAECDGGYFAMPGGLSQVPQHEFGVFTPIDQVVVSKDTWVLAEESDDPGARFRTPSAPMALRETPDELRSRNADDLFWLGRYTERLDNAARMMRSALSRIVVDRLGLGQQQELHLLIQMLAKSRLTDPAAVEWLPESSALRRAVALTIARDSSLSDAFRAIHRIAQALRDRMTDDMWHVVINLLGEAHERLEAEGQDADRLIQALDHLITIVAAFGGMASENMTRGSGWRFLDIGRRIERGIFGTTVMRTVLTAAPHQLEMALRLALELFDSTITYRSRYLAAIRVEPVIELIVGDETNPRGIRFQLNRISSHLAGLAGAIGRPGERHAEALARMVEEALRGVAPGAWHDTDEMAIARHIELLERTRERLLGLSDAITRAYFSQVQLPFAVGYEGPG